MNGVKRKKIKFSGSDAIGYLFMLPTLLGILVFTVYPMIETFVLSFYQTNGLTGVFVGFANYIDCLTSDVFYQTLRNTFYMGVLSILIGMPGSFIMASLINSAVIGKGFFKSVYFLPNIVSVVAIALIFNFMYAPTKEGILNSFLSLFGVKPIGWFINPRLAGLSVVLMECWRLGYDAIIFLAGLQSVPREMYEAAEIDGAGNIRKWWSITIPYLRPIFAFMLIMMTITNLKRFSDVYMIGTPMGNPSGSLLTVVLYIYRLAFTASQVGLADAAAYILFAIVFLFSAINLKLTMRNDESM